MKSTRRSASIARLSLCGLLSFADLQPLLPGTARGAPKTSVYSADLVTRLCRYTTASSSTPAVELVVWGALNSAGDQVLDLAMKNLGTSRTAVSGLGDRASYWEQGSSNNGLVARKGPYAVDVTAYGFAPLVKQELLDPPVRKALGAVAP